MVGDFGWEHEGTKSGVDTVKWSKVLVLDWKSFFQCSYISFGKRFNVHTRQI